MEETLIGWRGETYKPEETAFANASDALLPLESQLPDEKLPWVEVLSWSPRAFVYHNLLTDEECRHVN